MYRLLPLICCLLLAGSLMAQESFQEDTLPVKTRHPFEVGLNITNTLTRFIGTQSNGPAEDPYLIAFRLGNERHRWRMGLNFRIQFKEQNDFNFNTIEEKETRFNVRLGHEWVRSMSRRWAFYWGLDAVGDFTRSSLITFSSFNQARLESQLWGVGGGPVVGVLWRPHPRVTLSTESSVYAIYRSGYEEVIAFPTSDRKPLYEFVWQPILPSSLYVNFAF